MDELLKEISKNVYGKSNLTISNLILEVESRDYDACHFELNGKIVLSRSAKVTPKKIGQFVTFWKRPNKGVIEPFHESDPIDFFVVNVKMDNELGQFVFPKSVLMEKGIISTEQKEGKRGFRVYPKWDTVNNKQAERTQKWQLNYFFEVNGSVNYRKVSELYELK